MKAAQTFSGHFRPNFGKRSLRQCTRGKRDNIVLIEVDCDDIGDVIILDVPESFEEKFRKNVIKIDDEDDGESRDGACCLNNDASTSNRFSPTSTAPSSNIGNTNATTNHGFEPATAACSSRGANVNEDCLFVNEGNMPVKLSKSKRTYSGKVVSGNRYGLNPDSESSSESDCSDCEFMVGSFGKLREEWEMASSKRKRYEENKAGTSRANQPVHSCDDEGSAHATEWNSSAVNHGSKAQKLAEENKFPQQDFDAVQKRPSAVNHESYAQKLAEESQSSLQDCDAMEVDGQFTDDSWTSSTDFRGRDDSSVPDQPVDSISVETASEHVEPPNEGCVFSSVNFSRDGHFVDAINQQSEQNEYSQRDCDSEKMAKLFTGDSSTGVTKGTPHEAFESAHLPFDYKKHCAKSSQQGSEKMDKLCTGDYSTDVTKGTPHQNFDSNDQEHSVREPTMLSKNSSHGLTSEAKLSSETDQNDMIIDREKIKETDEYKRAMEEEWAARQQQLQRQAEEAQRLRSRKRAEKMRIIANERRQQQRIEEIRETRRKDEENLNLKDKLRVEIRKELRKLESLCGDMASLLRRLGIHVGGGSCPSVNEVQAAYKRACLKFHPDRMSTMDLRQQVEAEEKFKLISNMKEKFSSKR